MRLLIVASDTAANVSVITNILATQQDTHVYRLGKVVDQCHRFISQQTLGTTPFEGQQMAVAAMMQILGMANPNWPFEGIAASILHELESQASGEDPLYIVGVDGESLSTLLTASESPTTGVAAGTGALYAGTGALYARHIDLNKHFPVLLATHFPLDSNIDGYDFAHERYARVDLATSGRLMRDNVEQVVADMSLTVRASAIHDPTFLNWTA